MLKRDTEPCSQLGLQLRFSELPITSGNPTGSYSPAWSFGISAKTSKTAFNGSEAMGISLMTYVTCLECPSENQGDSDKAIYGFKIYKISIIMVVGNSYLFCLWSTATPSMTNHHPS